MEVVGWDATRTEHGWDVFIGDVYSGETKKIVAKVRVDGSVRGERVAADATAAYLDVTDGVDARSTDQASVTVTDDPAAVAASLDRTRAIEATRAVGSQFLDLSTRAYARGERSRSVDLAAEGARLMHATAAEYGDADLGADATELEAAGQAFEIHTPTSTEGRTLIKVNKERFRDLAR
ncbi:MAG: hypothetical protein ABMB14_03160 [Myxococcota bacterium]